MRHGYKTDMDWCIFGHFAASRNVLEIFSILSATSKSHFGYISGLVNGAVKLETGNSEKRQPDNVVSQQVKPAGTSWVAAPRYVALIMVGALLAAATSSAVIAQNGPSPGSLHVYRDWIVGCDNITSCHATSLAPEDTGADRAGNAAGGALVSVKRDPAERSAAIVGISLISGLEDGPSVTVTTLKVDDVILDLPFKYEKGVISLPPGTDDILIQRLLKGNILYLLDEKGETITSASLAGLSAALRHIDARQDRVGTQSAIIAKGNKAFTGSAIVPAYPVIRVPDPTKAAPAQMTASDAERARAFHKCRSTDQVVPVKYARLDRTNTVAILHALCGTGAYNSTVRVAIIDNDGRIHAPKFDSPGTRKKPDQFVNGWWDESKGLLGSYAKSRGIGDCGLVERYAWDGRQFRLAERREMSECRGSIDYITTWRANTLRKASGK